ncbi:MAG: hypothetical protein GY935_02600, partial [Gammaproteobacteria bacterium]|nr:hypothetical protein [Gammaproteobacteria bacterium]
GTTIGAVTTNSGGTLVLTFDSNATTALVNSALQQIAYSNGSDDPSASARIDWRFDDGNTGGSQGTGGALQATGSTTVTITAVNDAPTVSATATNPTHTEGDAVVDLFNTVSVSTVESGQTIEQIVLTVTNVTDGSNETLSIDGSIVYLVNGDNDTTGSGYDYMVDVIGNTATITIDTVGASVVDAQNLIDGFSYQNSSQNPTEASRVITITGLTDSGGGTDTSNPGITTTVNVVALNDAPTIALPVGLLAYTENDPASIIDAGTFINDVDGGDFDGGTLTVTFSSGGTTSDQLSILAGGNVTLSGTDVLVSGTTVGSFAGGANGSPLVISWDNNSSASAAQEVVRQVAYHNISDNPSTAARVLDFVVTDGDGGTSNTS